MMKAFLETGSWSTIALVKSLSSRTPTVVLVLDPSIADPSLITSEFSSDARLVFPVDPGSLKLTRSRHVQ